MGIAIQTIVEGPPWPAGTRVTFTCDEDTSMLCRREVAFTGSYIAARSALTRDGWVERQHLQHGRLFICPECAA